MSETVDYPTQRHASGLAKLAVAGLVFVAGTSAYIVLSWKPVEPKALPEARPGQAQFLPQASPWRDPPPKPPAAVPVNLPMPAMAALPVRREPDPAQLSRESPIFGPGAQPTPVRPDGGGEGRAAGARVARADADDGRTFDVALKPAASQGVRATRLAHPELTIVGGSRIPCIIESAFTSDVPGIVSCTVPIDVRGFGGHVVLLPAGTRVVGQSQSGMRQGQRRAFVTWTQATTPEGVVVTLDSPAADQLGKAGLEGDLDNHFFERFGNAILLSFLDTGLSVAADAAAAGAGGTNYVNNFTGAPASLAGTALNQGINIPPTIEFEQGKTCVIYVSKNLSFSDVYQIVRR